MTKQEPDPSGLISEAFSMSDITAAECRSIFLDWALRAPDDLSATIQVLLDRHQDEDHPMTAILQQARHAPPTPRRRGGRAGRLA